MFFGSYNLQDLALPHTPAEKERYAALVRIIRGLGVSVLAVQELIGDDTAAGMVLRQLADDTGLLCDTAPSGAVFSPAVSSSQHRYHTGLLWAPGIALVPGGWRPYNKGADFWHSLASAVLDVGAGRPLKCASFHGDPIRPKRRFNENLRVRSLYHNGEVGWVAADWNNISADLRPDGTPYDHDPYTEQDHDYLPYQCEWPIGPDGPRADRNPTEILRFRNLLTDTAAALDVPWEPSCGHKPDPWGLRRIDTFRVTRHLLPALRDHRTISTRDTLTASDHLPIVIEVEAATIRTDEETGR